MSFSCQLISSFEQAEIEFILNKEGNMMISVQHGLVMNNLGVVSKEEIGNFGHALVWAEKAKLSHRINGDLGFEMSIVKGDDDEDVCDFEFTSGKTEFLLGPFTLEQVHKLGAAFIRYNSDDPNDEEFCSPSDSFARSLGKLWRAQKEIKKLHREVTDKAKRLRSKDDADAGGEADDDFDNPPQGDGDAADPEAE